MPKPISLGEFEQIILLAILRLGENAYGVSIKSEITICTGRKPTPGALYTGLNRLEDKRLVASSTGDPSPVRGGRAKRYYTVTPKGIKAVTDAQRSFQRLLKGLNLPGVSHA